MSALSKLTRVEAKLFVRDPGAAIMVLGIPITMIVAFAFIPGVREPSEQFDGSSVMASIVAPLVVSILVAILAIQSFPVTLSTYREKGVLRRFFASPVPPLRLLLAQLAVNVAGALVVILLVVVVGTAVLGMEVPGNALGLAVVLLLGTTALFSVGLVIAAVAPTGRAANGIGAVVFFVMLALGGIWVPKEVLPTFLQIVADILPTGAMYNGLRETWAGSALNFTQLGSLVVFTGAGIAAAARLFRWE